jgi:hypothetical protein
LLGILLVGDLWIACNAIIIPCSPICCNIIISESELFSYVMLKRSGINNLVQYKQDTIEQLSLKPLLSFISIDLMYMHNHCENKKIKNLSDIF